MREKLVGISSWPSLWEKTSTVKQLRSCEFHLNSFRHLGKLILGGTTVSRCHVLILTLFTVLPHEPSAASTLPGDVVAVSSVLTLAYQRAVLSIKPQGTPCWRRDGRGQEASEEKHSSALAS